MTAVAILSLYLLDAAHHPETAEAVSFIVEKPIGDDTRYSYYSFYHVTQAAYQAGEPTWGTVWPMARGYLLSRQQPDGGWPQSKTREEPGRIYATAMAVLTLSVPYRLLPTYQR